MSRTNEPGTGTNTDLAMLLVLPILPVVLYCLFQSSTALIILLSLFVSLKFATTVQASIWLGRHGKAIKATMPTKEESPVLWRSWSSNYRQFLPFFGVKESFLRDAIDRLKPICISRFLDILRNSLMTHTRQCWLFFFSFILVVWFDRSRVAWLVFPGEVLLMTSTVSGFEASFSNVLLGSYAVRFHGLSERTDTWFGGSTRLAELMLLVEKLCYTLLLGSVTCYAFKLSGCDFSKVSNGVDALYYVCTTVFTVGYGDIQPDALLGRIFAVILMSSSFSLFVLALSTIRNSDGDDRGSVLASGPDSS